MIHYLS